MNVILCGTGKILEDTFMYLIEFKYINIRYIFTDNKNICFNNYTIIDDNPNKYINLLDNNDFILSIQCKYLFKKHIINSVKKIINLHYAPLPILRGMYPCSHAILCGMDFFGVTLHYVIDENIDNGDILASNTWNITKYDTAYIIYMDCNKYALKLIQDKLIDILNNKVECKIQNSKYSTYYPTDSIDFSDLEVNFNKYYKYVDTFIRSRIFPNKNYPYFLFNSKKYKIVKSYASDIKIDKNFIFENDNILCKCKNGTIIITEYILSDI